MIHAKRLRLCPFCGSIARMKIDKTRHYQMALVSCMKCSCRKIRLENPYYDGDIEQDMIKSWNKRVGGNDESKGPACIE